MRARHRIAVVLGVLGALTGAAPAAGQGVPPASSPADKNPKLDSALVALAARDAGAARTYARAHGLDLDAGGTRVSLLAHDTAAARAALRRTGATDVRSAGGRVLEARVPQDALPLLAASSAVEYVAQPPYAEPLATDGEGPAATGASAWHAAGVDGAGVKVAIVDLGFTDLAASQARGDIPNTVITRNECATLNGNTNHGTAVAEIVHEMAPAAQLYLVCIDGTAGLNNAKDFLVSEGVSIANFSVAFFNTARGDGSGAAGTPDAIVADAASKGILWVNSAGNAAQTHYQGTFVDATVADGRHFHDFGAGDLNDRVDIGGGQTGCAFLRWDEWSGGATDFDLIITDGSGAVVASGANDQSAGLPPVEAACVRNNGANATSFFAFIQRFKGTGAPRMDLFTNNGVFDTEYSVPSGSLLDPGASPSVFTVAAICFQNDSLEPYSSRGPTIDGRVKPDIAGQDAVTSGVYGPFSTCGSSGFTGTSAAAPHTAGAAALVKQVNPDFSAAQLRSALESRAGDLGAIGKDTLFGTGKLLLGAAPGSVAPTASTGVASAVTTAAATVAGSIDPLGSPTTYHFEFGPTTGYGRRTAELPIALLTGPQPVTAALAGLSPSTTYHYRLVARNYKGTVPGNDATFTTAALTSGPQGPAGGEAPQGGAPAAGGVLGATTGAPTALAARPALVTCKLSGRKVTCKVRLAKAKRATVKLTRGGKLFARATGRPGGGGRLKVRTLRRPVRGRYQLSVTVTDRKGRVHRLRSSIML